MTFDPPRQTSESKPTRTIWSRGLLLFGTILLVSFGLCGINLVAVMGLNTALPASAHNHLRQTASTTLVTLGFVELFGMAVGVLGIIVSMLGAGVSAILGRNKRSADPDHQ